MNPPDLESLIQRKLAELPAPKAPGTLLPRIMAEVRRTGRSPRRQRTWTGEVWQRQAVRLAASTALILMGGLFVDWASDGGVGSTWGLLLATAEEATIGAGAVVHESRVLWRVLLEPIAAFLVLWVGGMWVFLALLWEALRNMLWEGSVQQ